MKLVRSWPRHPADPDAPRVFDDAYRVAVDDYNYRPLLGVNDDVLHLDWDTAVSRDDVATFAALASQDPGSVLVAPVPVYPDSRRGLSAAVWNLKRYTPSGATRYVTSEDASCHLFGFGMLYLPAALLRAFVEECAGTRFGDIAFAGWHYRRVRADVPIAWQVRPVHVHYRISEVPL